MTAEEHSVKQGTRYRGDLNTRFSRHISVYNVPLVLRFIIMFLCGKNQLQQTQRVEQRFKGKCIMMDMPGTPQHSQPHCIRLLSCFHTKIRHC